MHTHLFDQPIGNGARIGPFALRGLIAIGKYAEVFAASELVGKKTPRECRVKLLVPSAPESVRQQFRVRNYRLAKMGAHPNVESLIGMGRMNGVELAAFEMVAGMSLASFQRTRSISLPVALAIARSIARGLSHAHSRGVVHGALEARNVWVTELGEVKVCDFGGNEFSCFPVEEWARPLWSRNSDSEPPLPSQDVGALARILLRLLDPLMAERSVPHVLFETIARACARKHHARPSASEFAEQLSAISSA